MRSWRLPASPVIVAGDLAERKHSPRAARLPTPFDPPLRGQQSAHFCAAHTLASRRVYPGGFGRRGQTPPLAKGFYDIEKLAWLLREG
jgi:hypothetical protein